jgi:hypothetical protein
MWISALSHYSGDKLHAVVNRYWPDEGKVFSATYTDACQRWYEGLSGSDRAVAILAAATFQKGDEAGAERMAAALPAAPKLPLEG